YAFYPSDLYAEQAPQARLDAGLAVAQAGIGQGAEIAAQRVGRHFDAELRHHTQHGGDEGVAVWPRPDAIVAGVGVGVILYRRFDAGNESLGYGAADVGH